MPSPNKDILNILREVHTPCPHLAKCNADWSHKVTNPLLWQPERGFVPCSFFGAFGEPDEVQLVIVIAEPSNNPLETFPADAKGPELLTAVTENSYQHVVNGAEPYHQRLRRILELLLGSSSLPEQLRRTWVMSSVLCSIPKPLSSTSEVPSGVEARCSSSYLFPALRLFRNAEVVALGTKAYNRLQRLAQRPDAPEALAQVIPAMHPSARPIDNPEQSWRRAAAEFSERLRARGTVGRQIQPHTGPILEERQPAPANQAWILASAKGEGTVSERAYSEDEAQIELMPGVEERSVRGERRWTRADYESGNARAFPRPPYCIVLSALRRLGGKATRSEIAVEAVREAERTGYCKASEKPWRQYFDEYTRDAITRFGYLRVSSVKERPK